MDTLVRDEQAAEEARFERPPAEPPPTRACEACGAGLAAGQDWCLECGTAAPGRLGRHPGMRAAATIVGLTIALVAGAVTAGYAAINGNAGKDVATPPAASGAPVAQAPPSTPTAPPAATTPAAPAAPLPKVAPPKTAAPAPAAPAKPATPAPAAKPVTPAPAHTTPAATTPAKPAVPAPQAISLGADAAKLYDPYKRATASGDPANADDGDPTTAWSVTTPADGKEMQVGLVVDLGKRRSIKQLKLQTATPGFTVELYAADTAQLPPDILDTRWAHLHNHKNVKRTDTLPLASDGHTYRWVLMWFTVPRTTAAPAQPTVKIREFQILG